MRVDVHVPARYFTELLRLRCAPEWWQFLERAEAKEVTESMAAFEALKRIVGHEAFGDPRWVCLVPGDGARARTAALAALRTRWQCISIDPGADGRTHGVDRLSIVQDKLEPWVEREVTFAQSCCAVLAVHSHAPLAPLLRMKFGRMVVVSIPCCEPQTLPFTKILEFEDRHIWSPKNKVVAWDLRNTGSGWISHDTVVVDAEKE